jgi:hypothetical protein
VNDESGSWAAEEFDGVDLGEPRRDRRAKSLCLTLRPGEEQRGLSVSGNSQIDRTAMIGTALVMYGAVHARLPEGAVCR